MLKGIKVGDVVKVAWCMHRFNWLVKVDSVTTDGVSGRYVALSIAGVAGTQENPPFMFDGNNLYGIMKSDIPYPVINKSTVSVVLNSEYKAVISGDRKTVVVGCQKIPASKVLEIAGYLKEERKS